VQALAAEHDTLKSWAWLAPAGVGVARTRQLAPFQASAKATRAPVPLV
jgi:hypothetical protein